jgi:hyperosmotically inducible periplasmic protein
MQCPTGVLVALVALPVLGGGCRAMTGRSLGTNLDDLKTTASVKTRLTADHLHNLTWVDVNTHSGVVYLTGNAASTADKQRAEEVARTVTGVRRIVNNLHVEPADVPTAAPRPQVAAGETRASREASAASSPSAAPARQRVTGEVAKIDHTSGRLSLRTSDGDLTLQFPPDAIRNLREGDRVTVDVAVAPQR